MALFNNTQWPTPLFHHFWYSSKQNTKLMSHLKELGEEENFINKSQMLSDVFYRQKKPIQYSKIC